jgi:hypothetical protein
MKKKSIQELDSNQEIIIFSLLKEGRTINEVFDIINIPIHHHWTKLKLDSDYRKEIEKLKSIKNGFEKYQILSLVTDKKTSLSDLKKIYSKDIEKYKKDKVFSVLLNLVDKKIVKSKSSIPKHDDISKNGKVFRLKGKVVCKQCNFCLEFFNPTHFHRNNINESGLDNFCINCKSIKRNNKRPNRMGEYYDGEKIKKYNSIGNTIDRKCPKCKEFKSYKVFSHLYLGIGVCNDCYKVKNNSKLVKSKVEFFKGVQIRKYDINSMVTHKLCSKCFVMKEINEFPVNNLNKIDGRNNNCKTCYSEYQKTQKQKKMNPSQNT